MSAKAAPEDNSATAPQFVSRPSRRVNIYVNNRHDMGGRLLILPPQGDANSPSLAELCETAQSKWDVAADAQPLEFKRVFVSSGAEVTSLEDVMSDDDLYFSSGEDFAGPIPRVSHMVPVADKPSEQDKTRFLTSLASGVMSMASNVYDKSSTFVKDKGPGFVKVTLEKVEDKVETYGKPLLEKVVHVAAPWGDWADEKLDSAYTRLQQQQQDFSKSDFAKTVNEHLVVPLHARVVEPSSAFYQASMDKFRQLSEKAKDGKVQLDEFLGGLKTSLGAAWNDRLVEPAKAFHSAASENLQNTRASLGKTWNDKVLANFQSKLRDPAEHFYNQALSTYRVLRNTAIDENGKVSVVEFLAGMRVKLGELWNGHLVAPAKHLYERFVAAQQQQQGIVPQEMKPVAGSDTPSSASS